MVRASKDESPASAMSADDVEMLGASQKQEVTFQMVIPADEESIGELGV
jgi:hypothetical protein